MLKSGVIGFLSLWFVFDILRINRENGETEKALRKISTKIDKLKFKNSGMKKL